MEAIGWAELQPKTQSEGRGLYPHVRKHRAMAIRWVGPCDQSI